MSAKNITLSDYSFHHKTKTRWKDLDAFQHINNAVFLSYFEDARIALFDRWNLKPNGKSLIVASVKVNYYKQLLHPSDFLIGQKVSRIGTKSYDILSALFIDGNNSPACVSTVTSVCYDFINKKTVPVYKEIINDYEIE